MSDGQEGDGTIVFETKQANKSDSCENYDYDLFSSILHIDIKPVSGWMIK
jgi:hypothetical protein